MEEAAGPGADDTILARLDRLRAADLPVHGGRTMAYVYDSGLAGLDDLAARAQAAFAGVNGLDMTAFPSVVTLENDVVRQAADLLGGGPATAGTFTSGGTESCLLAVLTAREHAARTRGVTAPEIVLPQTAHAAFHKAAALFGLTPVTVPVDPGTFRVRPQDVAAALTPRTALVVASAPSYAHGVVDPVPEVAAAAAERDVLCHVDACIGGWYLGHRRLADGIAPPPPFDLAVPGVSSLSVDLHKYGYTPKGASVLLFRDAELRRHGWFAHASWPGYPVVNATLQGTKSAGPLAAAWAVLQRVGTAGYAELARRVHEATALLVDGIGRIDGLRVLGAPDASLVAVAADDPGPDPFVVADEMRLRGWYLQPQPAFAGSPANLHLTVTAAVADPARIAELLAELAAAVQRARALGPATVDPGIAEVAAALDPATLGPAEVALALEVAGVGADGSLPQRMAPVLAVLQALPAPLTERLLPEVISRLYAG
ncbi:aminotransferase class V-fold PLP-dependent enzyme [Streptomyces cocklensis]|uniref:Glutamate or tyrosine decarboxylase n=1 Tax=Actinacidiphila cocklensis TaxID=887465 RepID=A0A9W4DV33_9ACTN|nr:aminotransferase class V-fold PLP-dependent enzyme [Actinacidiphila cocklensis]MDD1058982.1 aminotransferase class V-fold PLP-dependent enzyme [Actinacidiphila cocklensis]WSX73496.1 aminotransferase class V-fold PLP-dependent enzyme [Streptomyces sp. NBC_00899]WSX80439.1 aminotransferase class V-fold PLP-dependent enzyme [Streptomyces sp. NBC_00899]CAG6394482.1 Glutamate or tyrosine decarboxylase [Actinacidiphila cocklensis]